MPKILVTTNSGDVVDEITLQPPIGEVWGLSLLQVTDRLVKACQIAFENDQ